MATAPTLTTNQLREEIRAALLSGTLTESEILQMVSTAEPTAATNGHAPTEPATDSKELPIFAELPEGLIDLPKAQQHYGCTRSLLWNWVRSGQIKIRGRLKAPARGGGYLMVAIADLEERIASPPNRGGRPSKTRSTDS